jgi:polysaccharide transporter, PST family
LTWTDPPSGGEGVAAHAIERPADPRDEIFSTRTLESSLNQRAARGAVLTVLSTLLKICVQFGSVAILARLISPSEFGVAALAMPVIMLAVAMSQLGLAQALIQRPTVSHQLATSVFWTNAAMAVVLALVVAGSGPLVSGFYRDPRVGPVFSALAVSVLCAGLVSPFMGILRRQMRFKAIEACSLGSDIMAAGFAVAAALMGASYWAIVVQHVTGQLLGLLSLMIASRWLPSRPKLNRETFEDAKSSIAFGGRLTVFGLSTHFAHSMATVIVGRSFGAELAGLYFRGYTLATYPAARLAAPLGGVFVPALSRLRDDPDGFRALYSRVVQWISMMIMPVGALFCASPVLLTTVLFGPKWVGTAPILAWLGVFTLQAPLANSLNWALTASGAVKHLTNYGFIVSAIILTALTVGSHYSVVDMTMIYVLSIFGIALPILLWISMRNTPLRATPILVIFGRELLTACLSIVVVHFAGPHVHSGIAILDLAMDGVMIGMTYLFRVGLDKEMRTSIAEFAVTLRSRR